MSSIAVIMLLISIIMIWGGLVLGIINLVRHPEDPLVYSSADEHEKNTL